MIDQHKPLTAEELKELRELEAKATPVPWAWESTGEDNTCAVGTVMDENDNFISGMVEQDADTIVVDSVCPEVSNQQDAAFIAAARNVLPRLLTMLTSPTDAALREAVERLEKVAYFKVRSGEKLVDAHPHLRTLLRAVQAQRLTKEQVEAVESMQEALEFYASKYSYENRADGDESGYEMIQPEVFDDMGAKAREALQKHDAAFPEAFGVLEART